MHHAADALTDRLYDQYGAFKDAIGGRIDEADCYDETLYSFAARRLPREARILDLGCGTGKKLESLLDLGFSDLTGCDPLLKAPSEKIRACRTTMQDFLAANDERFDLVILNDVLEHLWPQEIVELFNALDRALSDEGVIYARFPNAASPLSGLYQNGDLTHRVALNEFSLQQILTLTPFMLRTPRDEGAPLRRLSRPEAAAARAMNLALRGLLLALGYLAFRRRVFLMPNLVVIIGRRSPVGGGIGWGGRPRPTMSPRRRRKRKSLAPAA